MRKRYIDGYKIFGDVMLYVFIIVFLQGSNGGEEYLAQDPLSFSPKTENGVIYNLSEEKVIKNVMFNPGWSLDCEEPLS